MDDVQRRLTRLEDRQAEIIETLAEHTVMLQSIQESERAMTAELGGAPDPVARGTRDTIRWRVHQLENDRSATRAANAALEAARATNRQAWSRKEKAALFLFALVATVLSLLKFFGVGA